MRNVLIVYRNKILKTLKKKILNERIPFRVTSQWSVFRSLKSINFDYTNFDVLILVIYAIIGRFYELDFFSEFGHLFQ